MVGGRAKRLEVNPPQARDVLYKRNWTNDVMHLAYEERKHLRDDNKEEEEEEEEESEENMKSENNDYPSSQPSPRGEVAKQNRVKSAKRPK